MIQEMGAAEFIALTDDIGIDILFPNAEEGQVLTGERDPERVAARLSELYPGAMIALKLDADGSYVLTDGSGVHVPPSAGRLVDATGAGDAFAGALLAAWLSGFSAGDAARLANSVSAWVIERVGARPVRDDALAAVIDGVIGGTLGDAAGAGNGVASRDA